MSEFIEIHPVNPQLRLIQKAVDVISAGGVIVYPTDSSYALGCSIGNKAGMERIRRLRQLDDTHHFTLVCRDLSEISTYAKVGNSAYRMLKAFTPGPYTFLLKATHEVPRRLQHPKRKTVGLRIPDNRIALTLLEVLGQPLSSSTLKLPFDHLPITEPYDFKDRLDSHVEMIIDGGACDVEATTVIDLVDEVPEVIRQGKGVVDWL